MITLSVIGYRGHLEAKPSILHYTKLYIHCLNPNLNMLNPIQMNFHPLKSQTDIQKSLLEQTPKSKHSDQNVKNSLIQTTDQKSNRIHVKQENNHFPTHWKKNTRDSHLPDWRQTLPAEGEYHSQMNPFHLTKKRQNIYMKEKESSKKKKL